MYAATRSVPPLKQSLSISTPVGAMAEVSRRRNGGTERTRWRLLRRRRRRRLVRRRLVRRRRLPCRPALRRSVPPVHGSAAHQRAASDFIVHLCLCMYPRANNAELSGLGAVRAVTRRRRACLYCYVLEWYGVGKYAYLIENSMAPGWHCWYATIEKNGSRQISLRCEEVPCRELHKERQ